MSVQAGSKAVAKRASIMDGELFFMKQLLILREQIVPFDAEFSVVEKDLDFTHMRDYLQRILAGTFLPCPAAGRPPGRISQGACCTVEQGIVCWGCAAGRHTSAGNASVPMFAQSQAQHSTVQCRLLMLRGL